MILVDAHVHIYDCFDLEKFFDSAYSNFKNEAVRSEHGGDFIGILLLAERVNDNWFHHLSSWADGGSLPGKRNAGDWRFQHTDEPCSLHARSDDNRELFIVAGRQFVTLEGLELLSLATTHSFPKGLPIRKLIVNVRDKGGIPVIPWGFGKWMGRRGKIISQLLDTVKDFDFFMGDSFNRPVFLPHPSQLKLAQDKNIRNLPGSDPLPFQLGQKRPGSFGLRILESLDKSKPSAQLKKLIINKHTEINSYGEPIGFFGFIKNQLLLQVNRFQSKKPIRSKHNPICEKR